MGLQDFELAHRAGIKQYAAAALSRLRRTGGDVNPFDKNNPILILWKDPDRLTTWSEDKWDCHSAVFDDALHMGLPTILKLEKDKDPDVPWIQMRSLLSSDQTPSASSHRRC